MENTMKRCNKSSSLFLVAFVFTLFGSSLSAQGWGWGATDAVEEVNGGAMNYSNGFIVATGIGAISPLAQNPGMARATAVRAAKVDAMRNLLEAVMAVTVSSETTAPTHSQSTCAVCRQFGLAPPPHTLFPTSEWLPG